MYLPGEALKAESRLGVSELETPPNRFMFLDDSMEAAFLEDPLTRNVRHVRLGSDGVCSLDPGQFAETAHRFGHETLTLA